jgi:hypothetical protein
MIEERRATLHADRRIYIHSPKGASRSYAFRDLLHDGLYRVMNDAPIPAIDETREYAADLTVRIPTRYIDCVADIARDEGVSTHTALARIVTLGSES